MAAQNARRKLPSFSSGDPTDWKTWRRQFEIISAINAWEEDRARQEVAAAMEGKAARQVMDIPFAAGTPAALLNLYEGRFCPAAASSFAKVEYKNAEQREGESVLDWHARLRALFVRAYPNHDPANDENLRDDFILRLREPTVREWTWVNKPDTFQESLETASNNSAARAVLAKHAMISTAQSSNAQLQAKNEPGVKKEPGVSAFGDYRLEASFSEQRKCHVCDDPGHLKPQCSFYHRSMEQAEKSGLLKEGAKERIIRTAKRMPPSKPDRGIRRDTDKQGRRRPSKKAGGAVKAIDYIVEDSDGFYYETAEN